MTKKRPLLFLILTFVFLQIFSVASFALNAGIVIYGDSRSNPDIHRNVVSAILKLDPCMVFHLGDFVDTASSAADWAAFNDIASGILKTREFYPVMGNHDKGSELFFRNFRLLDNRPWYSVEREGIHFIVLDSNTDLSPHSPQYQWLVSDLSGINDKIRFRIVLMHQPIFSVVRSAKSRKRLNSLLLPLFKRYAVTAVFSGHDHNYQRFFYDSTYYIVTGGGGANLYDKKYPSPYLKRFVKEHNFCALSVEEGILKVRVFDTNLKLIDKFNIAARRPE